MGEIPLVVGLSVTYYLDSNELKEVIDANFQAMAKDSAAKVTAEIQRIVVIDRMLAQHEA